MTEPRKALFEFLRRAWWEARGCWYAVLNLPWEDARVQRHHKERFGG